MVVTKTCISFPLYVGSLVPNFNPDTSSESELSSNYSEEELKKGLEEPIPKTASSKNSPLQSRSTSEPRTKSQSVNRPRMNSQLSKELLQNPFPLEEKYIFRLACSKCLIKVKGEHGFFLKVPCSSPCSMDQLALKKKSSQSWVKVRSQPTLDVPFSGTYKSCLKYRSSLPCSFNPCTFAHGEGERLIWMAELEKKFTLDIFIEMLRRNNIVTSQELAEAKTKNRYIPGLGVSNSKPAVATESKNLSVSNSSEPSVPKQKTYTKISYITTKNIAPSASEPVPSNNKTNFPKFIDVPEFSATKSLYSQSIVKPKQESTPMSVDPLFQEENPFKKTHIFQMFCYRCLPKNSQKIVSHTCLKNILAFAEKGTSLWLRVRQRRRVGFSANYVLCDSVTEASHQCKNGDDDCTFAHNAIEQALWIAEKTGNFDLTGFIFSLSGVRNYILNFSRKYGTSFSFICSICFKNSKQIVYKNDDDPDVCSGFIPHSWNDSKILFCHSEEKIIKKSSQKTFFKICFSEYCAQNNCSLAHSWVERDFWMLLRETKVTEEELVQILQNCSDVSKDDSNQICPHNLEVMCYRCYLQGKKVKHSKCGHSKEGSGVVYLTDPTLKHIGDLPKTIPKNYNFTICRSMKNDKCQYKNRCTFAHSQEEIDIWKWMCYNNIKKVDEILMLQGKLPTEKIAAPSSIFKTSPTVKDLPVPHFCQFCNMSYSNEIDWEKHCASPEHNANVTCDGERQWNYREPPWNILHEKDLKLCIKHRHAHCLYSNSLDMHNLCPFAHRLEELEEWKSRFEWRQLKADMAKKPKLKSYIDRLQEKYFNSSNTAILMSETIPQVQLKMEGEKKISSVEKKSKYTWTFTVTSKESELKAVSFLHNKDRTYFTMSPSRKYKTVQAISGKKCKFEDNQWQVNVTFAGKIYGSFSQRIIFDFGTEPWLFRDLWVEIGSCYNLGRLQVIREKANSELWSPENREIVSLSKDDTLLKKYKQPTNVESIVTQDVIAKKVNRNNYVQKMHKLLYLEEFECQQKMSRYNLCGEMTLSEIIQIDFSIVRCHPKKLFGKLSLTDEISEDTNIGKMILTNCISVYISFLESSRKIYEVEIVSENNYGFKGYFRNKIYLSLSRKCIKELRLAPNDVKKVEVQFQFNRMSFCLMHFALDNLPTIDVVFPDPVKNVLSQKSRPINCSSKFLNKEQLDAVKYVLGERAHFLCPFILNGAYGTGKTETVAQSVMELLDRKPDCKILICTQCNSSADLYILKHLHEYMEENQKKSLLRTYNAGRQILTVPEIVRKYTLMTDKEDSFRSPQKDDFKNVHVVISTLENCYQLMKLELKGVFTHIFVDEAAQEFECKILLPLAFATEHTYIVLAGDHRQMGVQIHSAVAHQQGLGIPIMQRLFDYYANHPLQILNSDTPLHTLLIENYRSVQEITAFISTCFYGIYTMVNIKTSLPAVRGLKPLQLHVVNGVEGHSANSTSYYNRSEVDEVVDCVQDISSNWPSDLGPFDPKDICIVSAYRDQVILIRSYLREKNKRFKEIAVEHITNMPGKEFKVIIISTVRTCFSLDTMSHQLGDCNETDVPDFFFNIKLLNTAMTRAKYSIITVGDPVALCTYGECATIWRIYLNYCSRLNSVTPAEITSDFVRDEVNRILYYQESAFKNRKNMKKQESLLSKPSKTSQKPSTIKDYQTDLSQPAVTTRSEPSRPVDAQASGPSKSLLNPLCEPFQPAVTSQ